MEYNWDKTIHGGGTCLDISAARMSTSIINLILDIVIIVIPLPSLWELQIKRSRKIAISAILSLGGV